MVLAIVLLLVLSSLGVCFLFGLRKTLQWIVILFGFWFISINTAFFMNNNKYFLITMFTVPFIALLLYSLHAALIKKNLSITKANKNNFIYAFIILITFLVLFVVRIGVNKFNGDALFYAHISKVIKLHSSYVASNSYKFSAYYHLASLAHNPIDMYSVSGDLIQQFAISVALVVIIEKMVKNKLFFAFLVIITALIYGSVNVFASSSLNWTIVPIVFLFIIAFGIEDWLWAIFAPLAFSIFSLSAALVFPCAALLILFKKKADMKSLLIYALLIGLGGFVLLSSSFSIPTWANLIILSFIIPIYPIVKFVKSEFIIKNFLFFESELISKKRKKIALAIMGGIILISSVITYSILSIDTTPKVYFWIDVLLILTWVQLFILFIYQLFFEEKVGYIIKVVLTLLIIQSAYFILIKITNSVPSYIHDRISKPMTSIFIVLLFLESIKYFKRTKKGVLISLMVVPLATTYALTVRINNQKHQKSIARMNDTFNKRYYWITKDELKDFESLSINKNKMIFSDLPLFAVSQDIKTLSTFGERNNYFYGMLATMNMNSWSDIYSKKNANEVSSNRKVTLEYAEHFNDWTKFDKVDKFIFRNEKYAKMIEKHYKNKITSYKKEGHLFVLTM